MSILKNQLVEPSSKLSKRKRKNSDNDSLQKIRKASDSLLNLTLLSIGILPNCSGYHFLKNAVIAALLSASSCTKIYDIVGREMNCSPLAIERAIRYSVSRAYDCGKLQTINKLFSVDIIDNYRLTNSEIIALLLQYVQEKKPWLS